MIVDLRPVALEDARQIFKWQIHPGIRQFFRNTNPPEWQDHLDWIKKNLANQNKYLFLITADSFACGFLHLTRIGLAEFEVSILVSAEWQGKSIAKNGLLILRKKFPLSIFRAEVKKENIASKKLFLSAGFEQIADNQYVAFPNKERGSCVIRANSGKGVGLGHLRRCLELALKLQQKDCYVLFIDPQDHDIHRIVTSFGFDVINSPDQEHAICQTAEGADILLIDHYELNITAIAQCPYRTWKLAVFEDMGKRELPVDMAINGSPSAYNMDLSKLGAKETLVGPDFQIIRSDLRNLSFSRELDRRPTECLVTIGASDGNGFLNNLAIFVEQEICPRWKNLHINLVVGPEVSRVPVIRVREITVHHAPENMAELIAASDIALSASGQTLTELLYSAVPTIAICLAENQLENIRAFEKENCIISVGSVKSKDWKEEVLQAFSRLMLDTALRKELSNNATRLIDGRGAERIASVLMGYVNH